MSFGTTTTEITYGGNGVDTTFAIPFSFVDAVSVKVQKFNITDPLVPVAVPMVLNVDYTVTGTNVNLIQLVLVGADLIPTPFPLTATQVLRVYRDTIDYHQVTFSTYQFPYQTANTDLDRVYQRMQELRNELTRYVKLSQESVVAGKTLTGEEILAAIDNITAVLASGGGLPVGGVLGDFIQKTAGLTGEWISGTYAGYSARFNESFSSTSLDDTIKKILNFSYLGPQISLSASPAQSVREKGTSVASVALTANTTKRSNNITTVLFYRAGVLVSTDAAPSSNGSADSLYTSTTAFTDTMSFYATVADGTSVVTSNTVSYPFVYPYYYGAGAAGKTAAQVAALTKAVVSSNSNYNVGFTSANGDVYYFAYPASYGALTSILDENNFETISDWTLTTSNITGLDASAQSYRIYAFNNPVVAGSTNYTFKR